MLYKDAYPTKQENHSTKQENICVVRLRTTSWINKRGIHTQKSLIFLRRQCKGYNILEEDAMMVDVDTVTLNIVNLDECEDGIYKVSICNESRDWETGHIDSYDYQLIPYQNSQDKNT